MQTTKMFIVLIGAALLLPFSANAQITYGIQVTRNHAWQQYKAGTFNEDLDLKVWGYGFAFTIERKLSKYFSVVAEPGIIQRGAKCLPGYPPGTYGDVVLNANYFSLPLLYKARFPLFKEHLFVTAAIGPNTAWFVSGTTTFVSNNPKFPDDVFKLDLKNSGFNRLDVGVDGTVGMSVPIKKGFIDANLRYNYGVRDVDKSYVSKNRSVSYQIGYRMSL
jgi:hypothetical protein